MQILIDINDKSASTIIQNVALARQLNNVTDEEARLNLAAFLRELVGSLAVQGEVIRKRSDEQASVKAALVDITVT